MSTFVTEEELEQRAFAHERCPRCGAHPGSACTTESGEVTAIHEPRRRLAVYVPLTASERVALGALRDDARHRRQP